MLDLCTGWTGGVKGEKCFKKFGQGGFRAADRSRLDSCSDTVGLGLLVHDRIGTSKE